MLRKAVVATALVGAVAACANSSQSGPARAPGPTSKPAAPAGQVRTFAAYAPDGSPAVSVLARTSGSCWTASIAVTDPAAYRCLAGNDLLDPCFAPPHDAHPTAVACVPDPWSGARLVTLTEALPTPGPGPAASTHRYWALELANGAHCVAATGTVPTIGDVAMDYLCGTGTAAGNVHKEGSGLIAQFGSLTSTALQDVAVTTAWDG